MKEVNEAYEACKAERAALAEAKGRFDLADEQVKKIEAAIERAHVTADSRKPVAQIIQGVEVLVDPPKVDDDIALLNAAKKRSMREREIANGDIRRAMSHLSAAVDKRLAGLEKKLIQKTVKLFEAITEHCAEAEAIEQAYIKLGMRSGLYSVSHSQFQELRLDLQYSQGHNIVGHLKENYG